MWGLSCPGTLADEFCYKGTKKSETLITEIIFLSSVHLIGLWHNA